MAQLAWEASLPVTVSAAPSAKVAEAPPSRKRPVTWLSVMETLEAASTVNAALALKSLMPAFQ